VRQIWITRHGSPKVLELREAPDPLPGPGEVRLRTAAAGVNFADILARLGLYPDSPKPPCVVGYEVSGVVDAVGPGVTSPEAGAPVVAATRFGGYSDVVVVPAVAAFPAPRNLPLESAAALPVNYLTAWLMLIRLANLRAADRVLIHAAAGGVGLAAVQLCRWRGATVLGTASASKHERLGTVGVSHCIDPRTHDFETEVRRLTAGRGVDVVLDAIGGASYGKSYRCLAPLGRLFVFGASSFARGKRRRLSAVLAGLLRTPRFNPLRMMGENRGVFGVNLGHLWSRADEMAAGMTEILDLVAVGHAAPVIDSTFRFAEAARAHEYIQDRKNFGKVLLVP
jgi:NADPH:quinone reductase-like Zn-dependent oxidoreductase